MVLMSVKLFLNDVSTGYNYNNVRSEEKQSFGFSSLLAEYNKQIDFKVP